MSAVCVRCGGMRGSYADVCPACGHRPDGDGLLIAWLLSDQNLDEAGLGKVSARIMAGESVRPSSKMVEKARRALGKHVASDPGLSIAQLMGLFAVSVLLTPAVGWTLAWWWRTERPRAAIQCLALSAPVSLAFFVGVLLLS